ncbi:uncharacterized protein SPPG_08774 [Spizellomyces punctatus DAOM BR117]|uniref:Adenylate cyclase n=1 Tax=Spizellomyces punctatus (strain DAOM BR117) TaxID=645134 RepID=A0A0L0H3Q1_SPIPD|nr:uncharacterized protein SPPG_08774 [Spizellomyces punctatus DAOM BR117]KNC95832.1 hypothetical protein SPPG_08774 [Spizellomyces punctatus DAOM BR117]|eukprot:XP_016603872.1 hypothetical protein SPPG_08774 [Spizellomyces punctatus DAOM BR117]
MESIYAYPPAVHREDAYLQAYAALTGGKRRPSDESITSGMTSATKTSDPRPSNINNTNGSSADKLIMHTSPRRSVATDDAARLVYMTKFGGKTDFPLVREETTIGRKDDNHIALPCAKISKYHAVVKRGEHGYYIRDRNSSNGIKINEKLISSAPQLLKDGDKIDIGTFTLFFQDEVQEDGGQAQRNSYEPSSPLSPTASTVNGTLTQRPSSLTEEEYRFTKLVTILPSDQKYEESVTIRAEMSATTADTDFRQCQDVADMATLKEDYEKLRLAYELSKVFTTNVTEALSKSCELMFEILPVDRAVVLLVDDDTNMLGTHYVKVREGKGYDKKEICLSSTILRKVYHSRKCLITSDAFEDPMLSKQASVKVGQIRSVICVPLIAHSKVLGILHLDSRDRINTFSKKDLSLVLTISTQTAMAIENSMLIKEIQQKARLTENLSRFLPPHVVSKMTSAKGSEGITRGGGRDTVGTILFADIRGFTQMSEKSTPSEVVSLLNDYFERLVNIVFKYSGVVDKYIGDALMAAFGTLEHEGPDAEYRAVCAALEFKQAIDDMNEERAKVGKEPISIGIGLNTGELLTGFIGSPQRLEYTCIGDTVNTSSRICSMASVNQVLISQSTFDAITGRVEVVPVGLRMFKGKVKEVMVWEAIGILPV